jgi:hypothetical protein
VEFQSRNILRMTAFNEIFLMPMTVFLIFAGKQQNISLFPFTNLFYLFSN